MKSSAGPGNKSDSRPLALLLERRRPAILDGAMGTELERRGVPIGLPLWSAHALLASPQTVRQVHDDYIGAGADIITSNTFRTTRRTFLRAGLPDRSAELTASAVALARESIGGFPARDVLLAGSIAPLEDCYSPALVPPDDVLRDEHTEQAGRLAGAGVDFLLLETMGTIREAEAASRAARGTGLEFVVSFLCTPEGNLYGGEDLREAVRFIMRFSPTMISLNCSSPQFMGVSLEKVFSALRETPGGDIVPVGMYANVGLPGEEDGAILCRNFSPAEYATFARTWVSEGVSLVGGCCGTTPEDIRAIAGAFA